VDQGAGRQRALHDVDHRGGDRRQIAAICRRHGAAPATRNVKDFEDTGVEVVDPWGEG
jgi:predicted nucleic acid-binding protein